MGRHMTLRDLFPWISGSMTDVLEAYFQTRVHASILFHAMIPIERLPMPVLGLGLAGPPDEEPIVVRRVALCSDRGDELLYAETLIVPCRCPRAFQQVLRTSPIPLGRVLQDARLRVWREKPWCDGEPRMLPEIFEAPRMLVLERSYRLWLADEQPAMRITEWLPLFSEGGPLREALVGARESAFV